MFYLIKLFCFRLFSSVGVYLPLQSVEDRANLEFFGEICSFIQRYLYFLCICCVFVICFSKKCSKREKKTWNDISNSISDTLLDLVIFLCFLSNQTEL